MALASPYAYKPYAPPRTSQLAGLLKAPAQNGWTQIGGSQGSSPNTGQADYGQGRNGAPQLPYDEFGDNTSAPHHVGDTGPQSSTSSSSSSSSSGNKGGYDFNNDPILAQIRALNQRLIQDAESGALAGRKQSEITFGFDPSMHYEDPGTEQAARQNSFSTLAQLLFGHNQRARQTDSSANSSNLWYSSARAGAVRGEGRQYTLQQSLGNQEFQGKMKEIAQALLDVKNQAQEREIQGMQDAYDRALAYGGGGGGGGGSTGGGGSLDDFLRGTKPPDGMSGEQLLQWARDHAPAGQTPHNIAHEGEITYQNGQPGKFVKYDDPNGGTNTIWVPL